MPIGIEFQRRYATIVLDLEQLNKDLNKVLHKVQQYCYEVRFCWNLCVLGGFAQPKQQIEFPGNRALGGSHTEMELLVAPLDSFSVSAFEPQTLFLILVATTVLKQTYIKKKHCVLYTHELSLKSSHFTHPPDAKGIFTVNSSPPYLCSLLLTRASSLLTNPRI